MQKSPTSDPCESQGSKSHIPTFTSALANGESYNVLLAGALEGSGAGRRARRNAEIPRATDIAVEDLRTIRLRANQRVQDGREKQIGVISTLLHNNKGSLPEPKEKNTYSPTKKIFPSLCLTKLAKICELSSEMEHSPSEKVNGGPAPVLDVTRHFFCCGK